MPTLSGPAGDTLHVPNAYSNLVRWPNIQLWTIPSACAADTREVEQKSVIARTQDTNLELTLHLAACDEDAMPTKQADSRPTAGHCTDDHLALKTDHRAEAKNNELTTDEESPDYHPDAMLDAAQKAQFLLDVGQPTDTKMLPVPLLAPQMPLLLTGSLILYLALLLYMTTWIIDQIQQELSEEKDQGAPSNKRDEQGKCFQ